jgi:acyl-coenzyme A synthetase/AMP-(fatty) acid ligase
MIANIPSAVGFLIPEAEVEIVDAADNVLPAGSEGFVRLRTTQFVLNFQIDDPNAWYYPGDVGWLTEDGVLCIAGRKGDVLNRGGVKLSVTDLESFLTACAGIKDAGVCTVMGESGFEEVWVGLVFGPSADIATLRQQIEGNADFRTNIDKLFVVESIPRGSLGKIQRDELRKMFQDIGNEPAPPG